MRKIGPLRPTQFKVLEAAGRESDRLITQANFIVRDATMMVLEEFGVDPPKGQVIWRIATENDPDGKVVRFLEAVPTNNPPNPPKKEEEKV